MADLGLSEHDVDILWQYRNQQEDVLYGRINVFLIAQSLLFVAYTAATPGLIAGAVAFVGTALTLIGLLSLQRQAFVFEFATKYVLKRIPVYKALVDARIAREKEFWFHRNFSGQKLLLGSLPLFMLLIWLVLAIRSILSTGATHTVILVVAGSVVFFAIVFLSALRRPGPAKGKAVLADEEATGEA